MSNETRLKNIRKRHIKKPKAIVVLFQDEGIFYRDEELEQVVDKETLDNLLVNEDVTLVVIAYENMNIS